MSESTDTQKHIVKQVKLRLREVTLTPGTQEQQIDK